MELAAPLLSFGSSLFLGRKARDQQKEYLEYADPFQPYRDQYAQELNALMADPSRIEADPYYQWLQDQGQEAINRQMAAGGYLNSGNRGIALQDFGQGTASNYFQNKFGQLEKLAGVGGGAGLGAASQAGSEHLNYLQSGISDLGGGFGYAGYEEDDDDNKTDLLGLVSNVV